MVMRLFILLFVLLLHLGCARQVTRVAPETVIDLSGRWNDTDSRQVADQMILEILNSDQYREYAQKIGHKPVIIMGTILNRTSEHIDVANYTRKFEYVIHQTGLATMAESDKFREMLRAERLDQQDFAASETVKKFGKEKGADLMLFGEMTSETDTYGKKRVVNYVTTLFLTDIESGTRVWYGQREIKKYVKN